MSEFKFNAALKPRMVYLDGQWLCRQPAGMNVLGRGATMREAWDDMWRLHKEAVNKMLPWTAEVRPRREPLQLVN